MKAFLKYLELLTTIFQNPKELIIYDSPYNGSLLKFSKDGETVLKLEDVDGTLLFSG